MIVILVLGCLGVKNYQKVYTKHDIDVKMGQLHGGKRAKEFWQGPPPLFGQCPKERRFFLYEVFPNVGDRCDLL